MEELLAVIRAFVAGDVSPAAFRNRLYEDARFESLLSQDPLLRRDNYVGPGVYHFLLELDFTDPRDVLNAQGALADFMDRNGIAYTRTERYRQFHDLVLQAQPDWLDVDPRYVQDHMLPLAGERSGDELRRWLSAEFLRRFRSVAGPPDWVQSPAWPVGQNGPLVFLGQFDVTGYFHDLATVYVFHDPVHGSCETVIQVF